MTIVERLRDWQDYEPAKQFCSDMLKDVAEAADEIERLTMYLDGQVRYYNEQRQKDLAEIERLRAARKADSVRILKMSDEYEDATDEIERLKRTSGEG